MLPSTSKRYKFKELWFVFIAVFALTWPLAAFAGAVTEKTLHSLGLQAPFLFSWVTIWFFSICGGILSNFVRLDIDAELRAVYVAKPLMGTLFSVALIMYLNGDADPPNPSFALAALGTSFAGAPLMQGALVYITKENIMVKMFDKISRKLLGD